MGGDYDGESTIYEMWFRICTLGIARDGSPTSLSVFLLKK